MNIVITFDTFVIFVGLKEWVIFFTSAMFFVCTVIFEHFTDFLIRFGCFRSGDEEIYDTCFLCDFLLMERERGCV